MCGLLVLQTQIREFPEPQPEKRSNLLTPALGDYREDQETVESRCLQSAPSHAEKNTVEDAL